MGLGNPGKKYQNNRHNIGKFVVENFVNKFGNFFQKKELKNTFVYYSDSFVKKEIIIIVIPKTFMNLSGNALVEIFYKYKISDLSDILIIHDDKDFEIGKFKFQNSGSDAGHNGIKDLIEKINMPNFSRLRIGIGKPKEIPLNQFVLSDFSKLEISKINLDKIIEGISFFCNNNIIKTMNQFN